MHENRGKISRVQTTHEPGFVFEEILKEMQNESDVRASLLIIAE